MVPYGGGEYSGDWGLAAALLRSIEGGVPLLDASYLANLSGGQVQKILGGKGEIPMFTERLGNLREVGKVLQSKWNGQFARMIEAAEGSAVKLVYMVAEAFSSFRDVVRDEGINVPILKRAEILAVDLFGTFGGEGWGRFSDLDRLTAFADYKLPQILRTWGVLEYEPELAARGRCALKIDQGRGCHGSGDSRQHGGCGGAAAAGHQRPYHGRTTAVQSLRGGLVLVAGVAGRLADAALSPHADRLLLTCSKS